MAKHGVKKIITYTLENESGSSLKAVNFEKKVIVPKFKNMDGQLEKTENAGNSTTADKMEKILND